MLTFPWGATLPLAAQIMLGRAEHPDAHVTSLPAHIRDRICADYPGVSRFHLLLTLTAAGIDIEDLGSMNGTFRDGTPVLRHKPETISTSCELRLGAECVIRLIVDPAGQASAGATRESAG